MNTKKKKIELNSLIIKYCYILFVAIFNLVVTQGICAEFDEPGIRGPYDTFSRQKLLVDDDKRDEHLNTPLELVVTARPAGLLADETLLIEETLSREPNIISRAYIGAFKDDLDESSSKLLIVKCLASLGGFGAGISGIAAALQAGEYYGSNSLGYFFAASTVLYTGGVAAWAIWDLIEGFQSPQSNLRLNDDKPTKARLIKIASSLILGVFSSTPQVYVAYKYNTVKGIAALGFFYEWVFRSLGFYKFISPITMKKKIDIFELDMIKNQGLECIDQSKVHFLRLHKESNGSDFIFTLKNVNNPRELYSFLNSSPQQDLSTMMTQDVLPYYFKNGIPRKVTQYSALIFPLAGAFVNGVLTYKGISLITDNTTGLVILTGMSVLPTLVLDSFATKQVAGGIFDALYSCKSKVLPSDYFEFFNPKIKKIIIGSAIALSVSATGVGIYVILDNLEGTFLSPAKYVFTALAAISAVKFGSYAITNTLMNFGSVLTKQIKKTSAYTFNCLKKLNSIRDLIWESDTVTVENFLNEAGVDLTDS